MRGLALGIAAACFTLGAAAAQTNTNTNANTNAGTNAGANMAAPAPAGAPNAGSDRAAASGNDNQAVATTNANAPHPAHGANSFTASEARARIQDDGFKDVTGLKKDRSGVWRGRAQRDGQTVSVWLDYKGNVGGQ